MPILKNQQSVVASLHLREQVLLALRELRDRLCGFLLRRTCFSMFCHFLIQPRDRLTRPHAGRIGAAKFLGEAASLSDHVKSGHT